MREIHGGSSSGTSGRVGGGKKDETWEATVGDHLFYRPQRSKVMTYFYRAADRGTMDPPPQKNPHRSSATVEEVDEEWVARCVLCTLGPACNEFD